MGAEDYLVHTHHCRTLKKDTLDVWKPVTKHDLPTIQIEQDDDVTASVTYTAEDAPVLAMAILTAAGINATIRLEGPAAVTAKPSPAPDGTPPGARNIADSPEAIAAHFARPESARTGDGQRVGALHLRELPDGYWTRLRLVTESHGQHGDKEFLTTLVFDHHRVHDSGEQVRSVPGASFPVLSARAWEHITPLSLEVHHAKAAAVLAAHPEAIASLLSRAAGDTYRGPIR